MSFAEEAVTAAIHWALDDIPLVGGSAGDDLRWQKPMLFHNGAVTALDVQRTTTALMGYGTGLLGIVSIKVLAAGFYARHDMKTPMRVSLATLALTQVLNIAFVPFLQHAGLTLSIGLAQLVNAAALLVLLRRTGGVKTAMMHHDQSVRPLRGQRQIVQHHQQQPALIGEAPQRLHHAKGARGIQRARRLIEQQKMRVAHHGLRQTNKLALAARKPRQRQKREIQNPKSF